MKASKFSLSEIAQICSGDGVVEVIAATSQSSPLLTSVVDSSRDVTPNSLFVAIQGEAVDGHTFVKDAFKKGASAAVVSDASCLEGGCGIVVSDTRRALSRLAAHFCGEPSRELLTLGVTGTNGKTTVHFLLYHLLGSLGLPGIRIGTIGVEAEGVISEPGVLTTPSALAVQRNLAKARKAELACAVVETSSHALDQHRVTDVWYDIGIFTNLSRDHLDYHPDMDHYLKAKSWLFDLVKRSVEEKPGKDFGRGAVICIDDEYGRSVLDHARSLKIPILSYGYSEDADVRAVSFEQNLSVGTLQFRFNGHEFSLTTPFLGRYNGLNLCAVFCAATLLGFEPADVVERLRTLPLVPGRLEPVGSEQVAVFVDYSHTPDALENALKALQEIKQGKLWVVFGCGGDRDSGKRPLMGSVADEFADCAVVTSDNPRTEDPQKILDDILACGMKAVFVDPDRRVAIEKTLREAAPGDVVLIAGKGHEDYQIIGTERRHFSDQEEVIRLREAGVI